jgi:large subunit ribosomal protein L31
MRPKLIPLIVGYADSTFIGKITKVEAEALIPTVPQWGRFYLPLAENKSLIIIVVTMPKAKIHPEYFPAAKVKCACGNSFTVGDTKESLTIEICSNCHPFYTGEEKLIDTAGRVEKFRTRRAKAEATSASKKPKKERVKKTK